jgi:2-polyprenyl-3-methyl-5-hydroxy-6-metoxy-1,4-benzoquinol methylase
MWTERSMQAELLDGNEFSRDELFRNLKELRLVNQFLGGHANSVQIMKTCLDSGFIPKKVIDIGCGGGDSLEVLQKKFSGRLPDAVWTGCDLNALCLEYARKNHPGKGIRYEEKDFRAIQREDEEPVLFHASLFFHHFPEKEIVAFLSFVRKSGAAMIINDLQRHPLAWYGIKIIASLPGISRLFRNDAPLSVKRGFLRSEWESMLDKAGYTSRKIQWAWAFRYLIYLPPHPQST